MIDRQRLGEELQRMKELIRNDQTVRTRFDLDGNGEIDGDEWEQVRQLVVRRLEREVVEAREAERLAARSGATLEGEGGAAIGRVADQIYERDLPAVMGTMARVSSLAATSDLILEQQTRPGHYSILSPDGSDLGTANQGPDLDVDVAIRNGQRFTVRRTPGPGADGVEILDANGGTDGYVQWKPDLPKPSYHVVSTMDRGTLAVESQLLHPLTLLVLGPNRTTVGTIERGWSGLGGFLAGGNRTRIHMRAGKVTPGQRRGLIATALLEELEAARRTDDQLANVAR
jgi:hypothetical protein